MQANTGMARMMKVGQLTRLFTCYVCHLPLKKILLGSKAKAPIDSIINFNIW